MEIETYHPLIHSSLLMSWMQFYKINIDEIDHLPALGFFVMEKKVPIAVAFLRKVEGAKIAFFDWLIANPESSGKLRYHAIDFLIEKILSEAKRLGFNSMIALSVPATLKRSVRHGFQTMPQTMIALDLREGEL